MLERALGENCGTKCNHQPRPKRMIDFGEDERKEPKQQDGEGRRLVLTEEGCRMEQAGETQATPPPPPPLPPPPLLPATNQEG